jgi:preprotein translocase SecE subunit
VHTTNLRAVAHQHSLLLMTDYFDRVEAGGGLTIEVRGELAKVDFPNRQQTWQSTSVVIGACIIVGIYLYGLDQAFTRLVAHLVDLQK